MDIVFGVIDAKEISQMDKENVIFLAHFQPFHNGHVSALTQVCAPEHKFRRLFIAVASSDIDNTRDNPFSFGLFLFFLPS